jgi:acyl-CoA reductase-like NAD-dependent aldehyde dehydrogenase
MSPTPTSETRIEVRKTYKLYIGGAFPRSESGRTYEVRGADAAGKFLANAALGSRKDARDAVVAAAEGVPARRAESLVSEAIDRWVWYAGWSDKIAQVLGGLNPVAGPYFDITAPDPTGVVAVLAPQQSSLLGLVSVLAPVVVSGNVAVLLTSERRPLPAVTLSEVLATSDVPAGVVNVLTGHTAEVAPWLASHRDVNAIDLAGAAGAEGIAWGDLERAAADNLKRVLRPAGEGTGAVEPDWSVTPDLSRVRAFLETKTVWHPKGR